MALSHEEELARELTRRGFSRREVIKIGLRLGLGATSMADPAAAMSILALLPVLVVFFLAQRLLVQGVTLTGMDGC